MTDDRWIRTLGETLRGPIEPSPDFDRRVLATIARGERRRRTLARIAPWAMAAALALGFLGWRSWVGRPAVDPFVKVAFAIEAPAAGAVSVVGDFNDWDTAGTPLIREKGTSRWRAVVPLRNGIYRYAFLVDGVRWVADSTQPGPVDDFGEATSVVAVE